MKLATRFNHTRDGELLIVSRDLSLATRAAPIAPTLQYALDHWIECEYPLEQAYHALNAGMHATAEPFQPEACLSPLPRAYQWIGGSAYINHAELIHQLQGETLPARFWHEPLLYQGASDAFLTPEAPIPLLDDKLEMDFEAEIAIVTDDVFQGASPQQAQHRICLVLLTNAISLRRLLPQERATGFGFMHSRPYTAFSPVAVTPDELGNAWKNGKLNLPIRTELNGQLFGEPHAGIDMNFDFPTLISQAAKTRKLGAGTILSSGTVSNIDASRGFSCIIEKRMVETREHGKPLTSYLKPGDQLHIEVLDRNQHSIFGAIKQTVLPLMECAKAC